MKKILLVAFLVSSLSSQAQLGGLLNKAKGKGGKLELFEEEKLDFPQYQNHIGQVCFSNEEFERTLPEDKFIKTYNLGDKLAIRAFMANSPANSAMLQVAESGKKAKEINENKSFYERCKVVFVMYLDGKEIAGTSNAQFFERKDMTSLPTHRADINDGTEKDYFGESMYRALLERQELLTPGVHKLKIELIPLLLGDTTGFQYKPIAVGEIDMVVPKEIKVSEADCFPKSAMSDPKLEAEVLKACKVAFKENAPNAIKAILAFKDIYIIRGDYNAIIKKSFMAAIACKNSKGEVWYDYYIFDKMYDGAKYLPATLSSEITVNGYTTPAGKKLNSNCLKFLK
jgi:hypothetical protein